MNCPNCGAPVNAAVCEYCGTAFARGGLVEYETETYHTFCGDVYISVSAPKPSRELLDMVARGIVSAAEARSIVYG